jgi:NADP-dependent 3-hydroxy acid dehydrogenase YdfG
MDVAIVSGAASGLGLAISKQLIQQGFRVYGLGGNYTEVSFKHPDFIPYPCNLGDMDQLNERLQVILENEKNIQIIVNNAKIYPGTNYDELSYADVQTVFNINLLAPLMIVRAALPSMKQFGGHVINIGSNTPENSRGGPVGAATSGGLYFFGESLFEEFRDRGVKVTNLYPKANRYRAENSPTPSKNNPQSVIDVEAIAEAVAHLVSSKSANLITELVIRPQRIIEVPIPAPYVVPYPEVKPLPEPGKLMGEGVRSNGTRKLPKYVPPVKRFIDLDEEDDEDEGDEYTESEKAIISKNTQKNKTEAVEKRKPEKREEPPRKLEQRKDDSTNQTAIVSQKAELISEKPNLPLVLPKKHRRNRAPTSTLIRPTKPEYPIHKIADDGKRGESMSEVTSGLFKPSIPSIRQRVRRGKARKESMNTTVSIVAEKATEEKPNEAEQKGELKERPSDKSVAKKRPARKLKSNDAKADIETIKPTQKKRLPRAPRKKAIEKPVESQSES